MIGVKRNLAQKAQTLLEFFPAITILGCRQVGKTTLAQQLRPTWKYIDLENPDDYDLISRNPTLFFKQYPSHVIFDEAQLYPDLFAVLRGVIDQNREENGRFIITGSSSPALMSQTAETLAGRVGLIELSPLKANEFYQKPLSSFYSLLQEPSPNHPFFKIPGKAPLSNKEMQLVWFKGGYPEPLLISKPNFHNLWMENYRDTYLNRDIASLYPRLNKYAYRRFLTILSKLSGTIINRSNLGRALEISEVTVREYLSIAEGTFLWRSLPSFDRNVIKTIIKMPKGYIRDTGLLHFLTNIDRFENLFEDPLVGVSFETFVIEEIIRGIQATLITNWYPAYYRTRNGAEIDLILDGPFGIIPIEIKYGSSVRLKQLSSLGQFIEEHKLPLGIVINQSDSIEWLTEKIVQIPVGWV